MIKDFSLQTGIMETFHKDAVTGKITIHKEQDVEPLLELNKKAQAINNGSWKGDMHHVASIPTIVIEMWTEELKLKQAHNANPLHKENRKFLKAKLNSPDWALLRTKAGQI